MLTRTFTFSQKNSFLGPFPRHTYGLCTAIVPEASKHIQPIIELFAMNRIFVFYKIRIRNPVNVRIVITKGVFRQARSVFQFFEKGFFYIGTYFWRSRRRIPEKGYCLCAKSRPQIFFFPRIFLFGPHFFFGIIAFYFYGGHFYTIHPTKWPTK